MEDVNILYSVVSDGISEAGDKARQVQYSAVKEKNEKMHKWR